MKKLFLILAACFLTGCAEEYYPATYPYSDYGCVVIEDENGEREVCDTYYYVTDYGPMYWDAYYGVWIGAGGYLYNGIWYRGFWPGYVARYGWGYHPRGWFGNHGFRGYYSHHWSGAWHGGPAFHSYHGGGYHGGGGHGGHR